MQIFILGGTGSIGTGVVSELVKRSHQVLALSRSPESDDKLMALSAKPVRGDLSDPVGWAEKALSCDAIIQVAATFGEDMGDVDRAAMTALMDAAERQSQQTRMIYTGGCWLYGETGDEIATEDRPFNPLSAFDWMVENAEKLLKSHALATAVIHPAMVYRADDGGVFNRYLSAAKARQPIEIWGRATTRWPLIERTDLARAYCDLVERLDLVGHFNAVAEQGVAVGEIVSVISQAYGSRHEPIVRSINDVIAENGAWAKGPTLDQQMSGQKLKAATGWEPLFTDYRRTCREVSELTQT